MKNRVVTEHVVLQEYLEIRNLEGTHRRITAVPASLCKYEYNLQDERK